MHGFVSLCFHAYDVRSQQLPRVLRIGACSSVPVCRGERTALWYVVVVVWHADRIGDDPARVETVTAMHGQSGEQAELSYTHCRVIGNGSFGVVFQAKLMPSGEDVAIKKVLQDKRFKVRLFLSFAGSSRRIENCKLCGR